MKAFKVVGLISPDKANELGVEAESPVFVSPYVTQLSPCVRRGCSYLPLMYAPERATFSVHACAGIYHYHSYTEAPRIEGFIFAGHADCEEGKCFGKGGSLFIPHRLVRTQIRGCAIDCPPSTHNEHLPMMLRTSGNWLTCLCSRYEESPRNVSHYLRSTSETPWTLVVRDGYPLFSHK